MSNETSHWDAMDGEILESEIAPQIATMRNDFLYFQKYPNAIRNKAYILGSFVVIFLIVAIAFATIIPQEDLELLIQISGGVIFFLLAGVFGLFGHGASVKKSMTNFLVAEKNGWFYDPRKSIQRLNEMQKKFPILRRGGGKGIGEQYWGKTLINGKKISFWMGLHHYETGSGKHRVSHEATLMAFQMPRVVERPFYIREEMPGVIFVEKDIQLESIEFNKKFVVKHSDAEESNATEIMQVLTPGAQQHFLELAKKFEHFRVAFSGDAVLFSIEGDLLSPFYIDWFGKFEVNPRDEELMHERMNMLFGVAGEMVKFVD